MRSCVGTGINTKDEKAGASGKECKRGKDMPARHASAKYQLFINNPVAIVRLRLSCQGSGKVDDCKRVLLSADSRAEWPENYGDRAYTPTAASQRGAIELELRGEKASANQPGACRVPCVVFIHVETRPGQDSAVEFQLEASSEGAYALLLDGDDPSEFAARPSRPEYFLFDSRHPSPLLMLVATVPYDASDPDGSLVNMYVIDCSKQDGPVVEGAPPTLDPATAKDPKLLPSAEFNRYRGIANPRGQLVAMIAKGAPSTEAVDEGDHCYYRIAVVSHRLQPATITIRGFDWHPGLPVVLGEPLAGVVDGAHSFSYAVDRPASSGLTAKSVVLGLEVCAGDLRLQASMNPQKARTLVPIRVHTSCCCCCFCWEVMPVARGFDEPARGRCCY
ncbi:unnamed protein product [Polarella glacialis]|uniref:Uncharacterized protein n=1 Tax=Polarella glacialis TaxID=89957 RepID=A0A813KA01_POLGL|nr:unnamed protein product [Polarella glacialis]